MCVCEYVDRGKMSHQDGKNARSCSDHSENMIGYFSRFCLHDYLDEENFGTFASTTTNAAPIYKGENPFSTKTKPESPLPTTGASSEGVYLHSGNTDKLGELDDEVLKALKSSGLSLQKYISTLISELDEARAGARNYQSCNSSLLVENEVIKTEAGSLRLLNAKLIKKNVDLSNQVHSEQLRCMDLEAAMEKAKPNPGTLYATYPALVAKLEEEKKKLSEQLLVASAAKCGALRNLHDVKAENKAMREKLVISNQRARELEALARELAHQAGGLLPELEQLRSQLAETSTTYTEPWDVDSMGEEEDILSLQQRFKDLRFRYRLLSHVHSMTQEATVLRAKIPAPLQQVFMNSGPCEIVGHQPYWAYLGGGCDCCIMDLRMICKCIHHQGVQLDLE